MDPWVHGKLIREQDVFVLFISRQQHDHHMILGSTDTKHMQNSRDTDWMP